MLKYIKKSQSKQINFIDKTYTREVIQFGNPQ